MEFSQLTTGDGPKPSGEGEMGKRVKLQSVLGWPGDFDIISVHGKFAVIQRW